MSNTEGYTQRTSYDPRTIRRIANRAKNLIQKSIECDATSTLLATTLIDDFVDLVGNRPGTPPKVLISEARSISEPRGIKPTHQHEAGAGLGEIALEQSFEVELGKITFPEARQRINRKIRERLANYRREEASKRSEARIGRPSIPISIDTNSQGGSTRSRKQPYKRPNPQRRRKAA